jgi:ribonuclease HI
VHPYLVLPTKEGEDLILLKALQWVPQRGLANVIFESDSNITIDAVHSSSNDASDFGSVIT